MAIVTGNYSLLLSPGLKQSWHQLTGHMADISYHYDTQTYKIYFSQGFHVELTNELIEDLSSGFLMSLLTQLSEIMGYPTDMKINYLTHSVDIPIFWHQDKLQQYTMQAPQKSQAQDSLMESYVKHLYGLKTGMQTAELGQIPLNYNSSYHDQVCVYDLGDGMLVPVELCCMIVQMINEDSQSVYPNLNTPVNLLYDYQEHKMEGGFTTATQILNAQAANKKENSDIIEAFSYSLFSNLFK